MLENKEVQERIQAHNDTIESFTHNELPQRLGMASPNGKISISQWFQAQDILKEQKFCDKGRVIQLELREQGYDVKMDMQSFKLILY